MMQLAAGNLLGRYELLAPSAKGGMAQVWAARLKGTRGFHKLVAIKTVLPKALDDQRMERMFLEEAELASHIHHPNVVETLELGEQDGVLYLVMEWVDGEALAEVMHRARDRGGLPVGVAVNLIGQALKGLSAAHNARDENGTPLGIVHRDISPQNVLVTYAGMAKVVDFGIAKATSRASGLTELGEIKGKFSYMSPEQVRGELVDMRTDVFAMGILLYVISTGRHPFRGETPAETVARITSPEPVPAPSEFIAEFPPELDAVVLKSLAKSSDERYASAQEMLVALERALPQAFELSGEIRVAEYIKTLLADKAAQRRATIRMAKEFIDRTRGDSSTSSTSFSSLRGIAIEQNGPASAATPGAPAESNTSPTPTTNRRSNLPLPAPAEPPRQRRWPVLIGAVAVVIIASAGVLRTRAASFLSHATGTAAQPQASMHTPQPDAAANTAPVESANAKVVDGAAAPEPETSASSPLAPAKAGVEVPHTAHNFRTPASKLHGKRPINGVPSGAPPAPGSASAAAKESEGTHDAVRANPAKETSAWDTGNFGGRQ